MSKKDLKAEGKIIDVVSQDKDWRGVIENERRFQEGWQKDWGFLAQECTTDRAITKLEKIQLLEEKLKKMEDVKIQSDYKTNFGRKRYDLRRTDFNKRKESELLPQSRKPKAISKAYAHLKEAHGEDVDKYY